MGLAHSFTIHPRILVQQRALGLLLLAQESGKGSRPLLQRAEVREDEYASEALRTEAQAPSTQKRAPVPHRAVNVTHQNCVTGVERPRHVCFFGWASQRDVGVGACILFDNTLRQLPTYLVIILFL